MLLLLNAVSQDSTLQPYSMRLVFNPRILSIDRQHCSCANVHEGFDLIGASRSSSVEMLTAKPEQLESFGEKVNIKTVTEGLWFLWGGGCTGV